MVQHHRQYKAGLDVIGLSETILGTNNNKVCDIDGYVWEWKDLVRGYQ